MAYFHVAPSCRLLPSSLRLLFPFSPTRVTGASPASAPVTFYYTLPLTLSSFPAAVATNTSVVNLPSVPLAPSFVWSPFLTYTWAVVDSEYPPSSTSPSPPSFALSNQSAVLTGVAPGSSHTVTVTVADPRVTPATANSSVTLSLRVLFPAFTSPLHVVHVGDGVAVGSQLVPQVCVPGLDCDLAFEVHGVDEPFVTQVFLRSNSPVTAQVATVTFCAGL